MKNNMIYVEVSIKRIGTSDWKKLFIMIDRSTIDSVHLDMAKEHPYSFVNFRWDKGNSFIYGAPHQMMLDQEVLSDQEYAEKWYLV